MSLAKLYQFKYTDELTRGEAGSWGGHLDSTVALHHNLQHTCIIVRSDKYTLAHMSFYSSLHHTVPLRTPQRPLALTNIDHVCCTWHLAPERGQVWPNLLLQHAVLRETAVYELSGPQGWVDERG